MSNRFSFDLRSASSFIRARRSSVIAGGYGTSRVARDLLGRKVRRILESFPLLRSVSEYYISFLVSADRSRHIISDDANWVLEFICSVYSAPWGGQLTIL